MLCFSPRVFAKNRHFLETDWFLKAFKRIRFQEVGISPGKSLSGITALLFVNS